MNKIQELLNQRKELLVKAEGFVAEGNIEEFNAIEEQIKALDAKIDEAKLANANLKALQDNQIAIDPVVQSAAVEGGIVLAGTQTANTLTDEQIYENAWAKQMMGQELSNEELTVFENVNKSFNNAYTHDSNNTAVLIPTTVVAGIFKRAEEMYPFFGDAKKYAVRGKLAIKKHLSINAGDAAWYAEGTDTADEQNTFGELVLDGHELSKAVTVSWKLKAMAVADFIPYIINELAERVGVALGTSALKGSGANEPQGVETALTAEVGTPQVETYVAAEGPAYADVTALIAKLHSSYTQGAAFYANNNTIWTKLANIVDGNGRPIFIPDATSGGVGRLFGFVVKADAGVSDGNVVFGNATKGYVVNTNEPFSVTTEDHAKVRTTDYVAYAIIDGGVLDTKAFSLLTPGV